jgi:SAM-dependent methyltransferase
MAELQEIGYGEARNYTLGSPHLSHDQIRTNIERDLLLLVDEQFQRTGGCRVVEVGAGHGTFTACLAAAGATVTVTEMSEPSARVLNSKFRNQPAVKVIHDVDGTACLPAVEEGCDLLVFISVLHHIPDYLGVVADLADAVSPGGAFYSVQDPMWYPRRSRMDVAIDRGAYLAWRVAQGEVRRGLRTRWRRLRGVYDDTDPSDMIEYHVVRQGVDQDALASMLSSRFADVQLNTYWSTQSAMLQSLGERLGLTSTFGITARDRLTPTA